MREKELFMGTRGFTGFVVKGEEKLNYQQHDSYPDGVGLSVLQWLRTTVRERPEWLLDRALALQVVDEDVPPTEEQKKALAPYTDLGVSRQSTDDWYCLLRETQGDLEKILDAGYVFGAGDFPLDSLFCEWGYLIDLETTTLEVYKGFQYGDVQGRWAGRPGATDGYSPVTLAASWPLTALPTDEEFLAKLTTEKD